MIKQVMEDVTSEQGDIEQEMGADGSQIMQHVLAGGDISQVQQVPAEQVMREVTAAKGIKQLIVLKDEMNAVLEDARKKAGSDRARQEDVRRLETARAASEKGDGAGVVAALKGVTKWIWEVAKDVGAAITAKLIEAQLGLG